MNNILVEIGEKNNKLINLPWISSETSQVIKSIVSEQEKKQS